jgi:CBS domain-containing protein
VHGIFSERDLLLRVAHRWGDLKDAPVGELMTHGAETVDADAPLA